MSSTSDEDSVNSFGDLVENFKRSWAKMQRFAMARRARANANFEPSEGHEEELEEVMEQEQELAQENLTSPQQSAVTHHIPSPAVAELHPDDIAKNMPM